MKNKKFIFAALALIIVSVALVIPTTASAATGANAQIVMGQYTAQAPQSTGLSDEELINLFQVRTMDGSDIEVYTDYIDFSTPGSYQVNFYNETAGVIGSPSGFLTITDVKATINTTTDEASVMQNQVVDYKELFGVEAHEMTTGDLTDQVVVDDSAVNLALGGNYPIVFSVTDSEGNVVSKTVTLTVQSGKPTITGDYYVKYPIAHPLTDDQLIDLLNIKSSESQINVDQSTVDYGTPGEYHVSFTSTNSFGSTTFQAALILQ